MNILILGSGGREHAFAWKIRQSPSCEKLFVAPGNAGTATLAENCNISLMDFDEVRDLIDEKEIDLMIVGPEAPLVNGIVDYFEEHRPHLKVIGPKKQGAQLEGSKSFAKSFMQDYGIPTAAYIEVTENNLEEGLKHIDNTQGPYVLKADGLAGGKGVLIIHDKVEAKEELRSMLDGKFGKASEKVVIEEFLDGIEFSVFILTDGHYYSMLPVAKDYKRIGEKDTGLNTGGMGAVSPVPFVDSAMMKKVREQIILPTLSGLDDKAIDYVGFIFFGLINVNNEPFVIEYNCRMGDPETQVVFPRIQNDILELFDALFDQDLYEIPMDIDQRVATTVVLTSKGYPGSYERGKPISIEDVQPHDLIFHAGTAQVGTNLVTNGGRVMALTGLGSSKSEALQQSMGNIEKVSFDGKYFRKDIGYDL